MTGFRIWLSPFYLWVNQNELFDLSLPLLLCAKWRKQNHWRHRVALQIKWDDNIHRTKNSEFGTNDLEQCVYYHYNCCCFHFNWWKIMYWYLKQNLFAYWFCLGYSEGDFFIGRETDLVLEGWRLCGISIQIQSTFQEEGMKWTWAWMFKGLPRWHWWREWQPTPVFLPGEFHRKRSPAGYSW